MSDDPTGYNALLDANVEARLSSARIVLGELFKAFSPRSVLDIGCGHGAWLRVARELGADEIQGVDGPWIDPDSLLIPKQYFTHHDLTHAIDVSGQFDLVMSLEVAEHLPAHASDTFIESMARHGDIILFSAAVPFQGGHGHINEQWPGYWAGKFADHGFKTIDTLRPLIWSNQDVFWWLRQNTLLFMNETALGAYPDFQNTVVDDFDSLAVIHPELYVRWVRLAQQAAGPAQ
jgi:SAM-dependent methyltransferase